MREIGFRGKRKDNRKWVYGYYIETDEREHYIFTGETGLSQVTPVHALMYKDFVRYEVILETVGQWTGIEDKNGVKIFEGDIVSYGDFDKMPEPDISIDKVMWKTGCFIIDGEYIDYVMDYCDIEAIGNIHDNPELLGGEEIEEEKHET